MDMVVPFVERYFWYILSITFLSSLVALWIGSIKRIENEI